MAAIQEEQVRTKTGFEHAAASIATADPAASRDEEIQEAEPTQGGESQQLEVWKLLSHVKDLPESLVKRLPMSALFQLNNALIKESKVSNKLNTNDKLLQNAQAATQRPEQVQQGQDDRKEMIHPARFLPGTSCSGQNMWLKARDVLGPKGVAAIGNYDMDSVGCGGCVTPRGWLAIHDPSSADLKLKLFHMPNVGGSSLSSKKFQLDDGEGALSVGESLKEIVDIEGFKSALNAAREAQACAMPWNRSIAAIQSFMVNTNCCYLDLQGNKQKAAILTEFVDFVLGRNALNWENRMPYLSTDDLSHVWSSWKSKRSMFFTQQDKPSGSTDKKNERKKTRGKNDICRRYNKKECPHNAADCKTYYGVKLRHVCDYYMPGNRQCEKDHPRVEHK